MPPFRLFQNQVGEGLPLQRLQKFPLRGINPRNGLLRLAERTEPGDLIDKRRKGRNHLRRRGISQFRQSDD